MLTDPLPEWLAGEKLLLVAVGEVEGGVDMGELQEEDVRVVGKTVTIDLPEARILGSSLDEDRTAAYDWDRGLLKIGGGAELAEEARRTAADRIVMTARESGIIGKAERNTEESVGGPDHLLSLREGQRRGVGGEPGRVGGEAGWAQRTGSCAGRAATRSRSQAAATPA
jgi:hypothetical protein